MKIAVFGHKRIPSREGGVEVVVEELSTRMAKQDHEVICYNRSGHHVSGQQYDTYASGLHQGVQLKTVPTLDKKGLAAVTFSFFAAICASFSKARVVHIHAEGPAFMTWMPRLFGKRVIVTVHGLDWQREKWKEGFASKYIRWGEKMAVRYAHEIIVLSRSVQQYFRDTYGRETVYIPNGVSKPATAKAEQITQRYGLHKDSYILFLGRLVPEKGIHYLIEAYRGLHTDKKLVIAGGVSDSGEYGDQLKQLAEDNEQILFTGFGEGRILEELYSNAYVYVLPSDLEGMPLSLLEAMSYGNCCVHSDIPECTEATQDKAVSFPKGDVPALQDCLQKLCDNPTLVANYKAQASDYICSQYSWDITTDKTLALYREMRK